jgi:hypothetical protein
VKDLSHHVADEARHALWLTDLLVDLGAEVGTPQAVLHRLSLSGCWIKDSFQGPNCLEDGVISALVAINVTEKRGCEYFAAHIHALESARPLNIPDSAETLERILPGGGPRALGYPPVLATIAPPEPRQP